MNPKSPMEATDSKLKELSSIGYKQGKDYDVVSLKVLEDMLGKAGGGIMDINQMTRPVRMAGGGMPGGYEEAIKILQIEIDSLKMGDVLEGTDSSKSIQSKQNLMDYYIGKRDE